VVEGKKCVTDLSNPSDRDIDAEHIGTEFGRSLHRGCLNTRRTPRKNQSAYRNQPSHQMNRTEQPLRFSGSTRSGILRVVIGADHAGFPLKQELVEHLEDSGHTVIDVGTDSVEPVDYPDSAADVARAIIAGEAERGIVVCGSGAGASIAANKITGVRSAVVHDHYTAHQAVEHDDMNVLALGALVIGAKAAKEITDTYLAAEFSGEERHVRRLRKVVELDRNRG
jgi:ribose 5-phosphate isomerase B